MIILVDADEVLEDFSEKWVQYLNERYHTAVKYENLQYWDMTKNFPGLSREAVYGVEMEEAFYDTIRPKKGAAEYTKKLKEDGHTLYVVTNTPWQAVGWKMEKVIFRYFPFIEWKDVIVTANKKMIRGDYLIDDGIHNLIGGDYKKLLMDAPYNRQYRAEDYGARRVGNWEEIYQIISEDAVTIG